jgi:hypothetical protein
VVTGHDSGGKAVVVSDGPAPRAHDFRHVPGMSTMIQNATRHAWRNLSESLATLAVVQVGVTG